MDVERREYLERRLKALFEEWYYIKEYGASENMFWTDGKKLNCIRWHIENAKKELQKFILEGVNYEKYREKE